MPPHSDIQPNHLRLYNVARNMTRPARFQGLLSYLLIIEKKRSFSPTPSSQCSVPQLGLSCGLSKHFLMNLDKTRMIRAMENWNVVSWTL